MARWWKTPGSVQNPEPDTFGADILVGPEPAKADAAGAFRRTAWKGRTNRVSARLPCAVDGTEQGPGGHHAVGPVAHGDPHSEAARDNGLVQHLGLYLFSGESPGLGG